MTARELTEGWLRTRKIFYGYGSILKRALDPKANCRDIFHLGVYLAANLTQRHGISYKLGRRLGADTPLEPRLEKVPLQSTSRNGLKVGIATRDQIAEVK